MDVASWEALYRNGEYQKVLAECNQAVVDLRKKADQASQHLLVRFSKLGANAAMKCEQYHQAMRHSQLMATTAHELADLNNWVLAHLKIGVAAWWLGDYPVGIDALKLYLKQGPTVSEWAGAYAGQAHWNLALCYRSQRDYTAAFLEMQRALDYFIPDSREYVQAWVDLLRTQMLAERLDWVERHVPEVATAVKRLGNVWVSRDWDLLLAHFCLLQGSPMVALTTAHTVLRDPDATMHHQALACWIAGSVHLSQGDLHAASSAVQLGLEKAQAAQNTCLINRILELRNAIGQRHEPLLPGD